MRLLDIQRIKTTNKMREDLQKKVDRAIKLIQSASKIAIQNGLPEIEVAYSGGKDSDVILELTKMSGVPYRAIYKNTTIDPSGTIKHAKDMGAEMILPKESFFKLIEKHGLPNLLRRFCCAYLKEYKILDYVIIGVRREESTRRAARYKEPEQCRVYSKKKGDKARQYFPILEWTSADVEEFIRERNIKCAPVYYDEDGFFHVERRLGCLACPMLGNKRLEQLKQYPNLVKAYAKALRKWRETHNDSKTVSMYSDEYEHLVRDFFYWRKTNQEWFEMNHNSFLPPPITRNCLKVNSI